MLIYLFINHPLIQIRHVIADLPAIEENAISPEVVFQGPIYGMSPSVGHTCIIMLRAEVSVGNVTEIYVGKKIRIVHSAMQFFQSTLFT